MKRKRLSGFSLMEMMVVLLIIAVVAAASAPMISKKMINSAAQNSSPWVWTGTTNAIAFNIKNNEDQTVTIGDVNHAGGITTNSRLFIKTKKDGGGPQIGFSDGSTKAALTIKGNTVALTSLSDIGSGATAYGIGAKAGKDSTAIGQGAKSDREEAIAIGFGSHSIASNSIAIGKSTEAGTSGSIAIGNETIANNGGRAIAIGNKFSGKQTKATGADAIAIGSAAEAAQTDTVALGYAASATGTSGSIAIGPYTTSTARSSTAIGYSADATKDYSTAIGYGAVTTGATSDKCDKQIVLGDAKTEVYIPGTLAPKNLDLSKISGTITLGSSSAKVYIPGSLYVDGTTAIYGNTYLAINSSSRTYAGLEEKSGNAKYFRKLEKRDDNSIVGREGADAPASPSDRRLKNVGDEITTGLDKIKELKIYNFTFKKDENKTPHIGVMAQDLQKVFPDAVTKGEDGFLRIRWEDMFYSMINAIKELDAKFEALVVKVQKALDLEEEVKALRAENKELKKQFSDLEKRIEKLEKKAEKRAKKVEKE